LSALDADADFMITDVVRGSFGFVLEEPNTHHPLLETPLKHVVDDVLDLIYRTSAPDEEAFDAFTESVDPRVLTSLQTFFAHLYSSGATMRLVEDERDIELSRDAISRARVRTDTIEISESSKELSGVLYLLPETRRFELHTAEGMIKGAVSPALMTQILRDDKTIVPGLLGAAHDVTLNIRTVSAINIIPKEVYRLTAIRSISSNRKTSDQ
jgi:hypothetical protein